MIDTVLTDVHGTTLGAARFPAVPLNGQIVVFNNGRYAIEEVQWHASPDANMVLIVRSSN